MVKLIEFRHFTIELCDNEGLTCRAETRFKVIYLQRLPSEERELTATLSVELLVVEGPRARPSPGTEKDDLSQNAPLSQATSCFARQVSIVNCLINARCN